MPLSYTHANAHGYPLFLPIGDYVSIIEGLSSCGYHDGPIALDGHEYSCGAEIIFKNGQRLDASVRLDTARAQPLMLDSVWCTPNNEDFYGIAEPELLELLEAKASEVFPIQWRTIRRIEHADPGPYAVDWTP